MATDLDAGSAIANGYRAALGEQRHEAGFARISPSILMQCTFAAVDWHARRALLQRNAHSVPGRWKLSEEIDVLSMFSICDITTVYASSSKLR